MNPRIGRASAHAQKATGLRRQNGAPSPICKTCGRCRVRKVKCDGTRPSCASCLTTGHNCCYPEDARRSGRLSKAEIEALQSEVAEFRRLYRTGGGHQQPDRNRSESIINRRLPTHLDEQDSSRLLPQAEMRTPPATTYTETEYRYDGDARDSPHNDCDAGSESQLVNGEIFNGSPNGQNGVEDTQYHSEEWSSGPSHSEARIAGAVSDGTNIRVHGMTSVLHQTMTRPSSPKHTSQGEQRINIQVVKDQLFSNAALQRQRELALSGGLGRGLGIQIDFDGVDPEMAIHLLDLHWNRTHFGFLLTYRPSIVDSLTNNGPYVNKLLLNAIYFSSSLYSCRSTLRADPKDPQSVGQQFYARFKRLLIDEIDRPSLPTVVALLLCGASLVASGSQSAGWILCGIAYRMVTDLGCHLSIAAPGEQTAAQSRLTAVEIEMRTRIYWGAFLTDKFQSLYLGRPSALRRGEARVPKVLLDSYEELENWTPYIDPIVSPTRLNPTAPYKARPAYAISSFLALITLGEIASAIACTFYRFESLKTPPDQLLKAKSDIGVELQAWINNLPEHLRFDPEVDYTPPPHQITPHTTYHTLIILLERPFFANGHLASLCNAESQSAGESRCIAAAFKIWHLIDAYKLAFTLRRAPYLLSYAAHSAIVVLLTQTQPETPPFIECIQFFWFALLDLQRGCNSGLGKPLKILQTLMQRLGKTIPGWDPRVQGVQRASLAQQSLDDHEKRARHSGTSKSDDMVAGMTYGELPAADFLFYQGMGSDNGREDWLESAMNSEGLMDDSLFGLFTSGQPAFPF